MNEIPDSNSAKSESVVRHIAILLLLVGAIALALAVLHLVIQFFLPVGALAAIVFLTWWAVRKLRETNALPMSDEIKAAARNILREGVRLTGKALRATAAAAKAICEESKR